MTKVITADPSKRILLPSGWKFATFKESPKLHLILIEQMYKRGPNHMSFVDWNGPWPEKTKCGLSLNELGIPGRLDMSARISQICPACWAVWGAFK